MRARDIKEISNYLFLEGFIMEDVNPPESLVHKTRDPLLDFLNRIIVVTVKILAVLMVAVIIWSLIGVAIVMYQEMFLNPAGIIDVSNTFYIFGAFLMVLIGVEIFLNIIFYLRKDAIHVPLVLATALTAIARKVIILDYTVEATVSIYATAALVAAVGITYWLVTKQNTTIP